MAAESVGDDRGGPATLKAEHLQSGKMDPSDDKDKKKSSFVEFAELATNVQKLKDSMQDSAERVAREDLDRMARTDKKRLKRLIDEYSRKLAE